MRLPVGCDACEGLAMDSSVRRGSGEGRCVNRILRPSLELWWRHAGHRGGQTGRSPESMAFQLELKHEGDFSGQRKVRGTAA